MTMQESPALEPTREGKSSNEAAPRVEWAKGIKARGLTLILGCGITLEELLLGIGSETLQSLAAIELLELRTGCGADRRSLARALHGENAATGSLVIELDAAGHDAQTVMAHLVHELTQLAGSPSASVSRDAIRSSTVFIDNAQFLCETSIASLQQLIDRRRKGAVVPRILVGTVSGHQCLLQGLEIFELAPLSRRPQDISAIVTRRLQAQPGSPMLTNDALGVLLAWPWPGEEQELLSFLDRVRLKHAGSDVSADEVQVLLGGTASSGGTLRTIAEVEEDHIYRVLDAEGWNRTRSAKTLGIDVKTLYNKLRRYESRRRMPDRS